MPSRFSVRMLTQMAMLAALSIILVYAVHFPIFPAAPFLEYDPADIMLILGTFLYGPGAGLLLTAAVCVIQGITVSAASGIIGILMHFVASGSYVLLAGLVYRRNKTPKGSILAVISGTLARCVSMLIWNILLTPVFMGVSTEAVLGMLLPVILPFNLIYAGANSIIAASVFRAAGRLLIHPAKSNTTGQAGG